MVSSLILGGIPLVLVAAVFWFLWFTARKLRVVAAACPRCVHRVQGLVEPQCPECGRFLGGGVLAPGGIPPRPRRWLGFVALGLSLPAAGLSVLPMPVMWSSVLQMVGLSYMHSEFNRSVVVQIDPEHQLKVVSSADFVEGSSKANAIGDVEVVLSSSGLDIAVWKGTGLLFGSPVRGVRIDGGVVIASLQSQVPPNHDSPFARILNSPVDSGILGKAIVSYAAPTKAVSGSVLDSVGRTLFDGRVSASQSGRSQLVLPDPIWYLPMFVVPLVCLLAFLLLGLRILIRRRALEPFVPEPSVN